MKLDTLPGPVYRLRFSRCRMLELFDQNYIPFIKQIRCWTDCGLKEAKGIADKLRQSAQWEVERLDAEAMVDVYIFRGDGGCKACNFAYMLRGMLALEMKCTEEAVGKVEVADELYGNQVLFCVETPRSL